MPEAFFSQDGDLFVPSEATRGPWDPGAQHAGPPSALLGRAVERCEPRADVRVGRITFEILRPVPLEPLAVEAQIVRSGRSVELVEASLSGPDGEVMRARGWRLQPGTVEVRAPGEVPPPGPQLGAPGDFFPTGQEVGYHTAMEYRFVTGGFLDPGPATVWMRMRVPLVEGEEPSALQRVLVAADSGNGVSAALTPLPESAATITRCNAVGCSPDTSGARMRIQTVAGPGSRNDPRTKRYSIAVW